MKFVAVLMFLSKKGLFFDEGIADEGKDMLFQGVVF